MARITLAALTERLQGRVITRVQAVNNTPAHGVKLELDDGTTLEFYGVYETEQLGILLDDTDVGN